MKAFGPYAGTEEIDFTQLGSRTMFVISGKTGSGKTTIFDGISYAIYGKASGEDRNGTDLRSHFAAPDLQTEVSLKFILRNKTYFIKRSPQQEKKKDRGNGYTTIGAKAELYEYGQDGNQLLIAANVRDVDEKIKEIMLIDSNQFRQILMIPQGEFRKLLTSDSKDKEMILQRLFHTEIYKKMEEKLKEEATELKNAVEKHRSDRDQAIGRIQAVFQEELKKLVLEGNKDDLVILPLLKEEIGLLSDELERLKKEQKTKEDLRDKLQQQIFDAEALLKQLKAKDELLELKTKLENQVPVVEEQEKSIILAQKAALLMKQEELCFRLKKELTSTKEYLENIKIKIQTLMESYIKWETAFLREKELEPERKGALENINTLKNMEEDVRSISSFQKEVDILKKQLQEKKTERGKLDERIGLIATNSKRLTEEKEEIEKEQLTFYENERKIDKLKQVYDLLESYEQQQKQHKHAVDNLQKQHAFFDHIKSRYEDSKILVQDLEQKWLHGQATTLADKLRDDEECPVCGSLHHPKPAVNDKEIIPNEEDLKAAKQQSHALESEKNSAESLLLKAETVEHAYAERLNELRHKIKPLYPDFADNEVNSLIATISGKLHQLKVIQENILEKKKKLEKILDELEKLEQESQTRKIQSEQLTKEENALTIQYTKNHTLLVKMYEKIPQRLQTIEGFEKELLKAQEIYDELANRFEQVQQNYQKTNEMLVSEKTRLEETEKQIHELDRKLTVEREIFTTKMTEQGFANYSSFHEAKRTEDEINKLQNNVRSFREEYRSVSDRFNDLSELLEGVQKPDIISLRESFGQIKLELDALQELNTNLIMRKTEDDQIYSNIETINTMIKSLEEKYQLIGHLYDMTRGQNTYRITFERYVLASFLDDILREANHRLSKMTSGRYELHRKTDRSKGNVQSGLELLVFDQYTGQERHVKTLSGGESFKAALSLALGLADIVQQYAGGVSLETMFIDEGFGTLDPESLDQSIEALIDIQSSGRLVGIISHVPELKERIDARLEVIATQSGSRTEFQFLN